MKADDILARKRELLEMRRAEEARAEPDNMALFLLNEELADLNAQLRSLRSAPRAAGTTHSEQALDRAMYREWRTAERDDEMREARRAYFEALKGSAEVLTPRQAELFDLWQRGLGVTELAERYGVAPSTVSRTITRCKARMRAEAERLAKALRLEGGTVFDLADREAAKVILSCLTAKQAVCLYLYYGEWLNLRECGELLGVDHTAVLRTVRRALRAIRDTLRCDAFTLDNADALSELAYELYVEQGPPEIAPRAEGAWGRKRLGYRARDGRRRDARATAPPVLCTVRTSDGLVSGRGRAHDSLSRPMSRLLSLLLTLRQRVCVRDWLARLFGVWTKRGGVI